MKNIEKEEYIKYFYSNPILKYCQSWGHIVTEKMLGAGILTLDLGCGAFDHMSFANRDKKYIGVDIDRGVLKIGKEKYPNVEAVCANAEKLPFEDNYFDNIISVFSLEHIGDLGSCIAELARVLKPQGCLAVALPTEGFIFRLGRRLTSARYAKKNLGFKSTREYEEMVAQNHVNSLEKVLSALTKHFEIERKIWFPFGTLGGKNLNINLAVKAKPLNQKAKQPYKAVL